MSPTVVLKGAPPRTSSVEERLRALDVPGVSVAVIHHGRLAWVRAWGVADARSGRPLTPDTRLMAGSISKPAVAMTALRLVAQGRLGLDEDVDRRLVRWHLPPYAWHAQTPVTLRGLLSHTAGIGNVGGPGYGTAAPVPTLIQALSGEPPATSPPVTAVQPPGQFSYSNDGYTIVQALIEDVSGRDLPELADAELFAPIGMHDSTFAQPHLHDWPGPRSFGHNAQGQVLEPGQFPTMPEMAPGGLWTTPRDLAKLLLAVRALHAGRSSLLPPELTRQMLTPGAGHWGLGWDLEGGRVTHHGQLDGFLSTLFVTYDGEGVAIIANGNRAKPLLTELVQAVATRYGWPWPRPEVRRAMPLDAGQRAQLVGRYDFGGPVVVISDDHGQLRWQAGYDAAPLYAAGPDELFTLELPLTARVERDEHGAVRALRVRLVDVEHEGKKIASQEK